MKRLVRPIALLTWLAATPAAAQTVQRCEGPDGKVTYSNTQCPTGTQPVRKVNTDPAISVDDQKAAKERKRRDAEEVKAIEKQRKDEESKAQRDAADRKKADAKGQQKCDKARRDLDAARTKRADLSAQPATIDQIQKAEADVRRRESDVGRDCPH